MVVKNEWLWLSGVLMLKLLVIKIVATMRLVGWMLISLHHTDCDFATSRLDGILS